MQKDIVSSLKSAFIEYIKIHNEYSGKIIEFFNHIDEANKVLQDLPDYIRNDLKNISLGILTANGILPIPIK